MGGRWGPLGVEVGGVRHTTSKLKACVLTPVARPSLPCDSWVGGGVVLAALLALKASAMDDWPRLAFMSSRSISALLRRFRCLKSFFLPLPSG